jgi:protein gp37
MATTKIEWATKVWNPITGCSPISEGCQNCWAEKYAHRLQSNPKLKGKYADGFKVTFHPEVLNEPTKWKIPQRIFVCSMGDIFHADVKWEWVWQVMQVIYDNPQHIFMLLTKRPLTMYNFFDCAPRMPDNLWLGATIEHEKYLQERATILNLTRARVKFVSFEPALSRMDIYNYLGPDKINWVIAGGETGFEARPVHPDWFRLVREQCQTAQIPFFFKGWGEWSPAEKFLHDSRSQFVAIDGRIQNEETKDITYSALMTKIGKKKAGYKLDGKQYHELPKI